MSRNVTGKDKDVKFTLSFILSLIIMVLVEVSLISFWTGTVIPLGMAILLVIFTIGWILITVAYLVYALDMSDDEN